MGHRSQWFEATRPAKTSRFRGNVKIDKNLYIGGSQIPVTSPGTIYYVDPTNGSDDKNGLTWDSAKKTIQAAVDLTGDRTGDIIYVAPGKIQENVLIEKDHDSLKLVAIAGPWETQWRASDGTTKHAFTDTNAEAGSSSGIGLFVGARNVLVDGFCFDGGGGYVGVVVGDGYGVGDVTEGTSQNPASTRIVNCHFRASNEGTAISGLVLKGCSDNVIVDSCTFRNCDYGVYIASGSGRTNQAPIIKNCHFYGCSTYGVYKANENTDINCQVIGCTFLDGDSNTMTYGVKMQGTGVHFIAGNNFGCTNSWSASATDWQSGNFKPVAGNSVTYCEMEA